MDILGGRSVILPTTNTVCPIIIMDTLYDTLENISICYVRHWGGYYSYFFLILLGFSLKYNSEWLMEWSRQTFYSQFEYLLSFFFFSNYSANEFSTMFNGSGESKHPCLVSDLRGKTSSFLPLSMILTMVMLYVTVVMWRYVFSVFCWEFFAINGYWILSCAFSASVEIFVWFLSFILFMYITLIDLWLLNHLYILRMNSTWSWCIINPLNVLLCSLCQYFGEDFCINIYQGYCCHYFLWHPYVVLVILSS